MTHHATSTTGRDLALLAVLIAAGCSSGPHPGWDEEYERTVRAQGDQPRPADWAEIRLGDFGEWASRDCLAQSLRTTGTVFLTNPEHPDLAWSRQNGAVGDVQWLEDDRGDHPPGKPNALRLRNLRGDFEEALFVYEAATAEQYYLVAAFLTPRQPVALPDETARSAIGEQQLAHFGMTLDVRQPYWTKLGLLCASGLEQWHLALDRQSAEPRVEAIVGPFETTDDYWRRRCLPVADFEPRAAELLPCEEWRTLYEHAARAGSQSAARALAAFAADAEASVRDAVARYEAVPTDDTLLARCRLARSLAGELEDIVRRTQCAGTSAVAGLERATSLVLDRCEVRAPFERSVGRALVAELIDLCRRRIAAARASSADAAECLGRHRTVLEECEWTLAWGDRLSGRPMNERLALHGELAAFQNPTSDVDELVAAIERNDLADDFVRLGENAQALGLLAMATSHYAIAHLLRESTGSETADFRTVMQVDPGTSALASARRCALQVFERIYPIIGSTDARYGNWREPGGRGLDLVPGARAFDPAFLGLVPGHVGQLIEFAKERGMPVLQVEALPHVIDKVTLRASNEQQTVQVAGSRFMANDTATQRWVEEMRPLAERLTRIDRELANAQEAAGQATSTESLDYFQYLGGGAYVTVTTTARRETLASMMDRAKAMDRAADLTKQREPLLAEYQRLLQRRPAATRVEQQQQAKSYTARVQRVTVNYTTVVRVIGGALPYETTLQATIEFTGVQHDAVPGLGLAAVDTTTTEAAVRADTQRFAANLPEIVRTAVRGLVAERFARYRAEVLALAVTAADRDAELAWFEFLFAARDGDAKPPAPELIQRFEMARK
ncbi:MAG: hypothetical protein JNM25_05825 [Planctomycetes bacterium]|nr:hypothetical protein [Planctomycetota bacterium]